MALVGLGLGFPVAEGFGLGLWAVGFGLGLWAVGLGLGLWVVGFDLGLPEGVGLGLGLPVGVVGAVLGPRTQRGAKET